MTIPLIVDPHPLLDPMVFISHWPKPLHEIPTPGDILRYFSLQESEAPVQPGTGTKQEVRDLLRHGGFKPSGRSKPASEYLRKALEAGRLSPDTSINAAVDICNVVSLHSALPISVVDAELARPDYRLGICSEGTSYVFNPSGQSIDISGLLSLHDSQGPCGGPVKDSQRTKTHDGTTSTLTVIWGVKTDPQRTQLASQWYFQLLQHFDVTVSMPLAQ